MRIGRRHWAIALSGALLAHVGVAVAVLWQPPEPGTISAGVGGIEISLGPAGGAPGSVAALVTASDEAETATPEMVVEETPPEELTSATASEVLETVEPVEIETTADVVATETPPPQPAEVTAPAPTEVPVETVTVEPIETPAVETAEAPIDNVPVALAELAFQPEVTPPQPAEAAVIAPAETVRVDEMVEAAERPPSIEEAQDAPPAPATETEPKQELLAHAVETPPTPKAKPRPPKPIRMQPAPAPDAPAPETTATPPPETVPAMDAPATQVAAVAPSAPGAGGRAGTQASLNAGSADDTTGGGMPGQTADFMTQLQAWLEKHKEYPRRARMRRQEGTALLYFVMDRDGQVLRHRLEQSSGHDLLDREVIAMIERAQPLPKMPDTMGEPRLELVVPVQFFLR